MPEQTKKLMHFTNTVVQEATEKTERVLRELEERKNAALHEAESAARREAVRRVHAETARVRAEAGREISRHLMDCKREISLRREEIAREVFEQVAQRIRVFVASPDYFDRLESQLIQAVGQFGLVAEVTAYLRAEDMEFAPALTQSARPVHVKFAQGSFHMGGLIVDCPEIGQRIDGSYDTAIQELSGHFAEMFGLSLSDDLAGA